MGPLLTCSSGTPAHVGGHGLRRAFLCSKGLIGAPVNLLRAQREDWRCAPSHGLLSTNFMTPVVPLPDISIIFGLVLGGVIPIDLSPQALVEDDDTTVRVVGVL